MAVCVLGKKIGMTQIYDKNGRQVSVTVVKVEDTYVIQKKTVETDGYNAIQIGAVAAKNATKARTNHCAKAKVSALRHICEVRDDKTDQVNVGDKVAVDTFAIGDFINVCARSIGKGFQGVIKRHGYAGGPGSHGSMFHREPGGIGSRAGGKACRKKVRKGKDLPGHMGAENVTVHNLEVLDVDADNSLLVVKGNIPGGGNNVVVIQNSFKKTPKKDWKVVKAAQASEQKSDASDNATSNQ